LISSFQAPNNQVLYSAVGDQSAVQFFDVNENSGRVFVRQPLYTGTASQYLVSLTIFDFIVQKTFASFTLVYIPSSNLNIYYIF
jgi:hypothetical protein